MAKNNNGPVLNVRAPKAKTPAQQRKAAINRIAAMNRLADLQAAQKAGFRSVEDYKRGLANEVARDWCGKVFSVRGYGGTIQRWLAGRIELQPLEVQRLVKGFLNRPNNVTMMMAVIDEAFDGFSEAA